MSNATVTAALGVLQAAKQANTECRSGDQQWRYNIAPAVVRDLVRRGLVTVTPVVRWRYESKVRGSAGWRKLKSPVALRVHLVEEV